MLFRNLYEDILIHQKLRTNQENPLINSIVLLFFFFIKIIEVFEFK